MIDREIPDCGNCQQDLARSRDAVRRKELQWLKIRIVRNVFIVLAAAFVLFELAKHDFTNAPGSGGVIGTRSFGVIEHLWILTIIVLSVTISAMLRWRAVKTFLLTRLSSRRLMRLLNDALHTSTDGIALARRDGTYIWVNDGMCCLTGYSSDELTGHSARLFTSGKQNAKYYERLWRSILSGETFRGELVNRRKDGSLYSEELIITPIRNYWGRVAYFIAISRDVTKRKHAAKSLQESENQYRSLVETMNGGLAVMDPHDVITYANSQFLKVLGCSLEEVVGRSIFTFLDGRNEQIVREQNQLRLKGGRANYELEMRRKTGETRIFDVSPSRMLDLEGRFAGSFAVFTDITDQRNAEERSSWLGRLLEDSQNEIYVFDAETLRLGFVNRGARENLGYSSDELQQMTPFDLKPEFTRMSFEKHIEPLRSGAVSLLQFHSVHERKDGSTYPVEVRLQLSQLNSSGVFVAFIADIKERLAAEKNLIQAKEEAEAMNRLKGAFLDNMSHEFRTPITGILGFADLLSESVTGDQREFVRYIQKAGRRLMGTLNSVLHLSLIESNSVDLVGTPCDLGELVLRAVELRRAVANEKGLILRAEILTESTSLLLDEPGINRVLDTLICNAIKFTDKGIITVQLTDSGIPGKSVDIVVRDSGIGIDSEFIPHLFDSFRQESSGIGRTYNGVGLGLAITRKLVHMMGGVIRVESKKGSGSVFTVSLSGIDPADGQATRAPAGNRRPVASDTSARKNQSTPKRKPAE